MDQPSDEIEQLRAQIQSLTQRVAALERGQPLQSVAARSAPSSGFGLTLVNRIGAITLALGVLFFFKYAADNNWIGPAARIGFGLAAAAGLLAFGEYLQRRGQLVLAQGITACGLATAYIAFYAAAAFYRLLLEPASLAGMVAVSGLVFALAVRRGQQTLAGFGVAAADLSLCLWQKLFSATGQTAWLLGVAVGSSLLAVDRGWAALIPVTLSITLISGLALGLSHLQFAVLFGMLAILDWAQAARLADRSRFGVTLYACGHAALVIALFGLEAELIPDSSTVLTVASICLAIDGVVLLAIGVLRNSAANRQIGLTMIGLVVAKLYLFDIWRLQYGYRITAFVALGVLLLAASFVYSRSAGSTKR